MMLLIIFILINSYGVLLYNHQKPLQEKLWSERCKKHSVVLNDCNWCWCDVNQRYQCKARVCEEVDMFGHFKDAIQDIDVGMEGHGAWRSKPTSCTPGVHYQRADVLCVCDENGNWPNPVCRDLFRVLHSVEVAGKNNTCEPSKLYLVGCNVCFCPSSGLLNLDLCTKKECSEDNPNIIAKDDIKIESVNGETNGLEVYATCNPNHNYKVNNMACECLKNNRLICNNSYSGDNDSERTLGRNNYKSYCTDKQPGKIFKISCNFCHCDENLNLFCTAKLCIELRNSKSKSRFKISIKSKLKEVKPPPADDSCIPGTKYKKDCNSCRCVKQNGVKIIDCTIMNCAKTNVIDEQKNDCVSDTLYEVDCKICYCYVANKVKRQVCQENPKCSNLGGETLKGSAYKPKQKLQSVDKLHGYCEPLHRYSKDCNDCRCLADGKTLMCKSMLCIKRSSESLSVDVIPVYMKGVCPKGQSYKLDCNTCFCLSNGNALCTTIDCSSDIINNE